MIPSTLFKLSSAVPTLASNSSMGRSPMAAASTCMTAASAFCLAASMAFPATVAIESTQLRTRPRTVFLNKSPMMVMLPSDSFTVTSFMTVERGAVRASAIGPPGLG